MTVAVFDRERGASWLRSGDQRISRLRTIAIGSGAVFDTIIDLIDRRDVTEQV